MHATAFLVRLFVHQSRLRSLLVDELQSDRIVKASAAATTSSKTSSRSEGAIEEESLDKSCSGATAAVDDSCKTDCGSSLSSLEKVIAALREEIAALSAENDRLQCLCTSMHANHRQQSLHVSAAFSMHACLHQCFFLLQRNRTPLFATNIWLGVVFSKMLFGRLFF